MAQKSGKERANVERKAVLVNYKIHNQINNMFLLGGARSIACLHYGNEGRSKQHLERKGMILFLKNLLCALK